MNLNNRMQKLQAISIAILVLVLFSFGVFAASFDFNPAPPSIFNLNEDEPWQ